MTNTSNEYNNSKPELYLITSFDITGSTAFKNNEKFKDSWPTVFESIFSEIINKIYYNYKGHEIWKIIGDEIVTINKIENIIDIYNAIISSLEILNDFSNIANSHSNGYLNCKAASWLFPIYINSGNIKLDLTKQTELIGANMDEGFRMAHDFTVKKGMTISFELTYLLAIQNDLNIPNSSFIFYFVGLESLKGVWNNLPYPICFISNESYTDLKVNDYFDNKNFEKLINFKYGNIMNYLTKTPYNKSGNSPQDNNNIHLLNAFNKIKDDYKEIDLKERVDNLLTFLNIPNT